MVQRVRRRERRRRQLGGDRGFVYLRGAAARVARPLEVALVDAPGEPPTFILPGGRRLYGLGPPPGRAGCPDAYEVATMLRILVPEGVSVGVAREWRREGLRFRLDHLETRTHADGVVPPPGPGERFDRDVLFEALGDALRRLRAAVDAADARGEGDA
ncbi:MAG TPA: hypothetical protein VFS43_23955 [Polyangiaceae bacterium]|nr:hypothetical protein [Polyangiaceae bacterium]